jgi:tetratricopeptide (TPR) repeat protein
MAEYFPATDVTPLAASMTVVDDVDIYLGIFAHRYGYVPPGCDTSIAEMEYNRAVERGIPCLIFLMHDDHPIKAADVETGQNATKLEVLKDRLLKEQVVHFFRSPQELRAQVIDSLAALRKEFSDAALTDAIQQVHSLHYISDIPSPPEPYIAHPYTLLQTQGLIGRQDELSRLTDWIVKPETFNQARILSVVAIGGMGKSALTWKWFNEIAPQIMRPLAGRIWWSFYESDASFENFVTRALAYVSGQSERQVKQEPLPLREQRLRAILDQQPFLVVLDGLERSLVAYARMDAPYIQDTDLDDQTANRVDAATGLSGSLRQSFVGRHQLRKTIDVRHGQFLRKLASVRASRMLISTRLYPADLQTPMNEPLKGCDAFSLPGLSDQDAIDLWQAFGAKGSRAVMLPVFRSFDKHPLLIQVLASEVANFRADPGNFDAWRMAHPDFNSFDLPLVQVQSHVLDIALRGLSPGEQRTLHVIAGFRMPASIDTLQALLIRTPNDGDASRDKKPFATLAELDATLTTLEDRGLLGWDRRANRYNLHPIVRGVTWSRLSSDAKADIYRALQVHFEAMPTVNWANVKNLEDLTLEDLTPATELYNTLIELGRYDDAFRVFRDRLSSSATLLYRLGASRQQIEIVERLFPDGTGGLPRLSRPEDRIFALNELAKGYHFSGQPGAAVPVFQRACDIGQPESSDRHNSHDDVYWEGNQRDLSENLYWLSDALRYSGRLREAESAVRDALMITRQRDERALEAASLYRLGLALTARGATDDGAKALKRSLRIWVSLEYPQDEGRVYAYLAELALYMRDPKARELADRAWELAQDLRFEADFIRAARLQGITALYFGDSSDCAIAYDHLNYALSHARTYNIVDEELPTLTALAELYCRQGHCKQAQEHLDEIWESAERGPYPLFCADALNILTQIERDRGNRDEAVAAATRAFNLSWCDGPPFAYHWGLIAARKLLAEMGVREPELPSFDASKFEPMPEVEIDPALPQ